MVQVAVNRNHAACIDDGGVLYTWGKNWEGHLETLTPTLTLTLTLTLNRNVPRDPRFERDDAAYDAAAREFEPADAALRERIGCAPR